MHFRLSINFLMLKLRK